MTQVEQSDIVVLIRKTQENIALSIGVVLALTLSVYFFTYAMVVDKGLMTILWGMAVSSLVFVAVLFRLQAVAFFVTRWWLARKPDYTAAFIDLSARDK